MNRRHFIQGALGAGLLAPLGAPARAGQSSPRPGSPNILLIMTDQQRYDTLGANGNPLVHTPHLDRLAAESANFSHCFVQSPVCVPSRACFFTGRYAHAHRNRVNYTRLAPTETLFPRLLREGGYRTGLIGKTHLYYEYPPTSEQARRTGFDDVELHDGVSQTDPWSAYAAWRRQHDPRADIPHRATVEEDPARKAALGPKDNPFQTLIDAEWTDTAWTGLRTRQRLSHYAESGTPFFLFSSFWKPHSPFEVPAPYDRMFSDVDFPLPRRETRESIEAMPPHLSRFILRNEARGRKADFDLDHERLQWIMRSYHGSISHIDTEVGAILDTLEATGLAENTVVVFVSDHGEQLLEHGFLGKNVFFEGSVRVPFMMRLPGRITPGRYDDLVMSIDLMPTLFDLCGLEIPIHAHGRSLAPLVGASDQPWAARECVYCENIIPEVFTSEFPYRKGEGVMGVRHPDGKMVRTRRWKYNYYPPGHEELFDLENDPGEFTNLARDPAHADTLGELRCRMMDWLITGTETEQIAEKWLI